MTVPQAGRLVKPQESDQTWPNGGRSGMTPGTSVRLFSTTAKVLVTLRDLISAVLAPAADNFRRGAVPGPTQRLMPENAKETRSSAAIRIIARKNLREDGSPKARREAPPGPRPA